MTDQSYVSIRTPLNKEKAPSSEGAASVHFLPALDYAGATMSPGAGIAVAEASLNF